MGEIGDYFLFVRAGRSARAESTLIGFRDSAHDYDTTGVRLETKCLPQGAGKVDSSDYPGNASAE
jgi:hypothetical protein